MNRQKAFTLIEVMVVVVIISIVAVVASSSYRSFSAKGKWSAATSCLTDTTQRLENYRQNHGKYPTEDIWESINSTKDCGDYYEGTVSVFNNGTQYVVAFCDRKMDLWSAEQNDIWLTIDTRATAIHYRNPIDEEKEDLDSAYEDEIDDDCKAKW